MVEIEIKAFFGENGDAGSYSAGGAGGGADAAVNREALIEKLKSLDFAFSYACDEDDCYYQAPDRDFRKTDEALRIRIHREVGTTDAGRNSGLAIGQGGSTGSTNPAGDRCRALVTYKGPKQDNSSHTRQEIETEIPDAAAATELFKSLGYKPVLTVSKHREVYVSEPEAASPISVCLDDVKDLGFAVELEKLIDESKAAGNQTGGGQAECEKAATSPADEKAAAREELLALLDKLGIPREKLTMKTYLEMLLER
jgi:adenylate cyclase class 2